jgi:uncharacterized protein (TIGR02145 family)
VITISGTPTAVGTFNYTFSLTGGCGSVNATGTITVTAATSFTCGTSTIADYNNINTYTTVSIGNQCWMAENLRTSKYSDGTDIPDETANTSGWGALTTGARTEYVAPGVTGYVSTYGYLYNWYAATDSRKICPTGWHVPTDSDWNKLVKSIDSAADTTANTTANSSTQSSSAGALMKKNDVLWRTNTGTNSSGFSALPGGVRDIDGSFILIRDYAFFWSASEYDSNYAWNRNLNNNNGDVTRSVNFSFLNKSSGASVRCLKD